MLCATFGLQAFIADSFNENIRKVSLLPVRWSSRQHKLFAVPTRKVVRAALLAVLRLRPTPAALGHRYNLRPRPHRPTALVASRPVLPVLPHEIWLLVLTFFRDEDWKNARYWTWR
jgi:hypothetical protein